MKIVLLMVLCVLFTGCGPVAERNTAGNQAYHNHRYDAALRAYQNAQVIAPDHPEAYYNAASAYLQLDDLEQAQFALEQALKSSDESLQARAFYNLGNVYFVAERYRDAIRMYQQALLLEPDDEDARYNLEVALLRDIPPTPPEQEQQTDPEQDDADPDVTPTDQPGGFDGPTPTPPPQDFDLSATPEAGQGQQGNEDSSTPVPQSQGEMDVEQAERLLDQVQQDQEALREYLQEEASGGVTEEKDW